MPALEEFRARWQGFVAAWARASASERDELVAAIVAEGLPAPTDDAGPADPDDALAAEVAVIRASGLFDEFGYMWHNSDLHWNLCLTGEGLRHFVTRGWRELRHPFPGFDLWFYWHTHLDPARDDVDPLLHYIVEGRREGVTILPEVREQSPAAAPEAPVRRVCLFAAFDVDGVVDQTVVDYLAELSRFADIYYLADCAMEDGELDKIAPYTAGAWAIRHGRYDFGSYSMLATDLVGWDVIDGYDEMLLANDSCWLVQPLDQVFAKMDATACDWWGLQATYEHFGESDHERHGGPLSLDEVSDRMRDRDLWRYSDFVHVGSYFLGYRRRVLRDPEFRRRLETVAKQRDKTAIILKYEIGFSRYLILEGYQLATFVDGILPYHPVYRPSAFALMAEGFPVLKRQFLYENPFSTPDLRLWKERVREVVPGADVDAMERNLRRIAPAWSLHRSFAIRSRPDGTVEIPQPIAAAAFSDEDRWVPSFDHWWGFPVDPRSGLLTGAVRAVFDAVKDDPSVRKIVLEGARPLAVSGQNVVRIPTESPAGQMYALRLGTIFTTVGPRSDVNHPISQKHHRFVQLGRPTGHADPDVGLDGSGDAWGTRDPGAVALDDGLTRVLVASSQAGVDAAAGLARLDADGVWRVGSPRVDLLVADEERLDAAHVSELAALRTVLAGRALVVVEPWGRPLDLAALAAWAGRRPDVVVAVRRGLRDVGPLPEPLVDLSDEKLLRGGARRSQPVSPETAWRVADLLVSGSAADLADWAVLGRPAVSLVPDSDVPLPTTAPDGLATAVDGALAEGAAADYLAWGRRLHEWSDGDSARRVVLAVKRTYLPVDDWLAEEEALTGASS